MEIEQLGKLHLKQKLASLDLEPKQDIRCIYYRRHYCNAIDHISPLCKNCSYFKGPKIRIETRNLFLKIVGLAMFLLKGFGISLASSGSGGSASAGGGGSGSGGGSGGSGGGGGK